MNWSSVVNVSDPNKAYDDFLKIFKTLYEKYCPLRKFCINPRKISVKPWFTKGLKNAFKKKNLLYKKFLQDRSDSNLHKYKRYKNKLTSILRTAEKKITVCY